MATTLTRTVENTDGNSVSVLSQGASVTVEIGTDTAVVGIPFTDPNLLRALAAHLNVEADILQNYQKGDTPSGYR